MIRIVMIWSSSLLALIMFSIHDMTHKGQAAVRDLGIDISTPFRQTFSFRSLTLSYRQWHTPKEEKTKYVH